MGVVDGLALGGRGVPRSKNNERSGWGCGKRLILGTSRAASLGTPGSTRSCRVGSVIGCIRFVGFLRSPRSVPTTNRLSGLGLVRGRGAFVRDLIARAGAGVLQVRAGR